MSRQFGYWCPKCSGEVKFESPTADYGRCSCGLGFGRAGLERAELRSEVEEKIRAFTSGFEPWQGFLQVAMFDTEEKADVALQKLAPYLFDKPRAAQVVPLLELMRPHMLEAVRKKADVLISVLAQQVGNGLKN